MTKAGWMWIGVGAAAIAVAARSRSTSGGVPLLSWTLNPAALGFDPNYIPPPPSIRTVAIANQTVQPSFQGGTITPSITRDQVLGSAAGNVFAGVPFMY